MKMALKDIVATRLDQLNLGAVEAATAGGIERTYIRDILEDKKKSVRADKIAGLARALHLDPGALSEGRMVPIDEIVAGDTGNRIILVSSVSAGALLRDDISDEALGSVSAPDLPPGDYIALRVEGTSMDRISPPDSVIIVNRADKRLVANACYVIADEDGTATYKRYRPGPDRFEPVSTFDEHKTIFPDHEPTIVGRVKMTMLEM